MMVSAIVLHFGGEYRESFLPEARYFYRTVDFVFPRGKTRSVEENVVDIPIGENVLHGECQPFPGVAATISSLISHRR